MAAQQPVQQAAYVSPSRQAAQLGGGRSIDRTGRTASYTGAGGQRYTVQAPSRTYHRIILAEFVGCLILVAAAPILNPATKSGGGSDAAVNTTVSFAGPLVRLTALCITFFVLALMASGPRTGKIAAALGGLVLCGAMLTAKDVWAALGDAFGATVTSKTSGAAGVTLK
jgi:hypothetical protein